jgi:hypothetical protein
MAAIIRMNMRMSRWLVDVLWKIVIPPSERTKVLSLLDRFNVNAYSLFGSDESLMETLAVREVDLKLKPSMIETT